MKSLTVWREIVIGSSPNHANYFRLQFRGLRVPFRLELFSEQFQSNFLRFTRLQSVQKMIIRVGQRVFTFNFLYFSRAYHSSYKIFTMSSLSSSSARSSSSDKYLENLKREKIKREGRKIFKQKLTLTREVPWNRCPHRTRCPRDSLRPSRRRNRATIHLAPLPPIPRPNQFRNWSIPGERKRERVFFEIVKRWMTDKRRRKKIDTKFVLLKLQKIILLECD